MAFLVESLLFKAKEAVLLVDVIDYHVVGIVLIAACANLDLFEVAEVAVFRAAGKGYSGIKEVYELGRSCEVILRDGFIATGRVGYDDRCKVILLFESDLFHHKAAGGGSFLGVITDERDVVNHEETGALDSGLFYGCKYFFFKVGADNEFGSISALEKLSGNMWR